MEDDFSNKAVWRKQVSQEGREYYVNLISGTIKYPPKPNEKKIEPEPKKNHSSEDQYIQQYTVDKVPFFVHMKTGVSSWTLPEGTPITAVKYITHLTDEGIPYYEDTEHKTTSWTLPVEKLSSSARRSSVALVKMNRRQSNVFMAAANQEQAEASSTAAGDGEPNGSDDEGGRSGGDSSLFKPRPRSRPSTRPGVGKSATQPRRYSNMAQKSQQTRSRSPPRERGGVISDARSMRQQSIAKLQVDGNATDRSRDSPVQPANRKPFGSEPVPDSPTISDVSSVTAPSNPSHAAPTQQNQTFHQDVSTPAFGETKPLVRQVFEKYEKNRSGWISLSDLQELCYDFGTFLSEDELTLAISEIDVDRDGRLSYEEFMVWWRTNDQFSTMKLSDAHTKLRTDCAAVYKRYDRKMEGEVTRQEFGKIHRELIREKLVKLDLDSCVSILDARGDGIVYFNDFMSWIERGQSNQSVSKQGGAEPPPKQKSLAKFFGSFLGGNQDSEGKAAAAKSDLVPVKDHPDYAKYFRMAGVGGNIMDIRKQIREAGLDENLIHTPEKLISPQCKHAQTDHLQQATQNTITNTAFGSYANDAESQSNGDAASVHIDDRAFTSMFKKKPQAAVVESAVPATVDVFLSKPLGITLGENVEDEEKGVHVSSCAAGGNAANTGLIEPGMLLLEACGEDVRFKDFDSVMDILRSAPAGEKIKLVFTRPGSDLASVATDVVAPPVDEPGDSDVSETSSVDHSLVPDPNSESKVEIRATLEPNDTDVSETSSVDRSVTKNLQSFGGLDLLAKPAIQTAMEPNDTDVSETSSVDRSVASRAHNHPSILQALQEPSATERRDSIKSVSSTESNGSHHTQSSKSSMKSHHSSRIPSSQISESHDNDNFDPSQHSDERAEIAAPAVKSLPNRSSFALRKAAAIRNAAARKRANSLSQSDVDSSKPASDPSPTSNTLKAPTGIFGLGDPYDSDPESAPPVIPKREDVEDCGEEEVEWRKQEPIISISNPQSVSGTSAELEHSQIIGRPRAPRKALPSILNRMKRQQSGDSVTRPERGGIARASSRPVEETPFYGETNSSSPTSLTSNPLSSLGGMGTTGSVKVPLPVGLLEKSLHIIPTSNHFPAAEDHQSQSPGHGFEHDHGDDRSRTSEQTRTSQSTSRRSIPEKRETDEKTHDDPQSVQSETRDRRATPLGRNFRGLRNYASKQQSQPAPQLTQPMEQQIPDQLSRPFADNLPTRNNFNSVPQAASHSPQLASKIRRDGLLIQSRGDSDPDSDSSSFSPKLIHKTIGSFPPNWNNSPPSIPKLGSTFSNSGPGPSPDPRSEVSESEWSHVSSNRSPLNAPAPLRQQRSVQLPHRIKTVDVGVQSDYAAYVDEQYLNSYQMLLGERQQLDYQQDLFRIECEERLDMLREEELSMLERMRIREAESLQKIRDEEDRLTARVREVEDIIMSEKEEIEHQWQDLHQAEEETHEMHRQKTSELLELMHVVRAHHDKLEADKKKIGRQRLQLDMALQDLNKFNHFTPHSYSPAGGDLKASQRRGMSPNLPYSPSRALSSGRRGASPSPSSTSQSWKHSHHSPSRAPSRDRFLGSTR